jgi:nitroreductase
MVVLGQFASPLQGAAFAVCILTPDPNQRWSIMFDAGQAAAYMQLAAWEMGIGSVPIAIYKPEDARAMFGFPNDLHMNAALAFGYPEDQTVFVRPPKGHAGRKPGKEIFHWEQW